MKNKKSLVVIKFRVYHFLFHEIKCPYFEKSNHMCKFDTYTHNGYLWCDDMGKCCFNQNNKKFILELTKENIKEILKNNEEKTILEYIYNLNEV